MKQLFRSGPAPDIRTFLLVLIAVGLMVLDQHSHDFHTWRAKLFDFVLPVQLVVDYPVKKYNLLKTQLTSAQRLLEENARLRGHQMILDAKLQKMIELQNENYQLRELLKSAPQVGERYLLGRLLAVSLDPALHQMIIDKGSRDGVVEGQPVMDSFGIIGQIINVNRQTSRVLLLTDTRSAIPVKNTRNGIRGIVTGTGDLNQLALINIPDMTDIKVGDTFVSSGLGLRYPLGYPVGVVSKVEFRPHQRFATILLTPAAHLSQSEHVLLTWIDKQALSQVVNQQLQQPLPQNQGMPN